MADAGPFEAAGDPPARLAKRAANIPAKAAGSEAAACCKLFGVWALQGREASQEVPVGGCLVFAMTLR